MSKVSKVLVIGSGPIIIGQAAWFGDSLGLMNKWKSGKAWGDGRRSVALHRCLNVRAATWERGDKGGG